jgi:hypothetical protein
MRSLARSVGKGWPPTGRLHIIFIMTKITRYTRYTRYTRILCILCQFCSISSVTSFDPLNIFAMTIFFKHDAVVVVLAGGETTFVKKSLKGEALEEYGEVDSPKGESQHKQVCWLRSRQLTIDHQRSCL